MESRVAPTHESCTRAISPLRRHRSPAPAAPLRHERLLTRMEKTLHARARLEARCAVSGATNHRRAKMSCTWHRAAIVPTCEMSTRRAAATAGAALRPKCGCSFRPAAAAMSAMRLKKPALPSPKPPTTAPRTGATEQYFGLDRAYHRGLGARTRLRKAKRDVQRARLAQIHRGDGALASGDTVVRAERVPRFAKADRLHLDMLEAARGIVPECNVRHRDARAPRSPRARAHGVERVLRDG